MGNGKGGEIGKMVNGRLDCFVPRNDEYNPSVIGRHEVTCQNKINQCVVLFPVGKRQIKRLLTLRNVPKGNNPVRNS